MRCQRCKEREGIIEFSHEPMNAMIRGYGMENICRECYIEIIETELKNIKANLKDQKAILRKEKFKERRNSSEK